MIVIPQGKMAFVTNYDGSSEIIQGPTRIFELFKTIKFLKLYTANTNQYLSVQYFNGELVQIPGPSFIWEDPLNIQNIQVMETLKINANEAIVVYFKSKSADKIQRKIILGPTLFIPQTGEWIHSFSWHGSSNNTREAHTGNKFPRSLNFNKLRLIPSSMYITVSDVRSNDDALIHVKLMLFYELNDIEKMLDSSNDPIGDFLNSVSSDVISFVSNQTFEQFKQNSNQLNDLQNYKQLNQRAQQIGYNIQKIVFRGYKSSNSLQEMTDRSIEARTQLLLDSQTQIEKENLLDMKLKRESQRQIAEQNMQKQQEEHQQILQNLRQDGARLNQQKEYDQELHHEKQKQEIQLKKQQNELQLYHEKLKLLQELGVNLDQYFQSQQKIDQNIVVSSRQNTIKPIIGQDETSILVDSN